MTDSDSGSDCFQSADEFEGDEEATSSASDPRNSSCVLMKETNNATLLTQSGSERNLDSGWTDHIPYSSDLVTTSVAVDSDKDGAEVRTYRKRPERLKHVNVPEQKKIDLLPTIDLVKVARADVLTDFTSQFTSTITKGLASFHEKSSTITGFVKDSLVNDDDKAEDAKFVYDDDRTKSVEPKSNINDEILKLSNAFAKLNEERQLLSETSQENIDISSAAGLSFDDHQSKKICVGSPSVEASIPSTFDSTNLAAPDSSEGWDEWGRDDLLTVVPDDSPVREMEFLGKEKPPFETECSNTEDSVGTVSEVKSEDATRIVPKSDFSIAPNNRADEENLETSEDLVSNDSATAEGWEDMIHDENHKPEAIKVKSFPKSHLKISSVPDIIINTDSAEMNEDILVPKKHDAFTQNATETPDVDGWDDWNISDDEDNDNLTDSKGPKSPESEPVPQEVPKVDDDDGWDDWGEKDKSSKNESQSEKASKSNNADEGWDDWGDDDFTDAPKEEAKNNDEPRPIGSQVPKASNEWTGWDSFGQKKENDWNLGGWGINTLISTATAVTSNISAVIETGLGVPDPETMARIKVEEERAFKDTQEIAIRQSQFPFQQIVAGVGKIVEVAKVQEIGSRVLSGGLDTLETIGKKTMEVLQEGDPGLRKKRAILSEQGQILSKILKEARDRAMEADRHSKELKTERRFHFETLFDDFQGLVHLEALEMLSKQCELRLEQIQQSLPADKLDELQETLAEVKELCEVDEEFDNVEIENFEQAITEVVAPLRNELSVAKILEVHKRLGHWLNSDASAHITANKLYDQAISTIAELTASVTMQFHKSGELLIVKERRKTVEEADCLIQLSSHLCYELKTITENLADRLGRSDQPDINTLISNLRVESENAIAYVKQAFQLLIPVIQLGAA